MLRTNESLSSPLNLKLKSYFPGFFNTSGRHVMQKVEKISGGQTNTTYRVRTLSNEYIARMPGNRSDQMINRGNEAEATRIAYEAGVAPEVVYDEKNGKRVSRFIPNGQTMNIMSLRNNPANLIKVIDVLKKLHSAPALSNTINVFARNREWLTLMEQQKYAMPQKHRDLQAKIDAIESVFADFDMTSVPCHNDTTPGNFILSGEQMYLIDYEYAGNNDPVWDLAYLAMEADLAVSQYQFLLRAYFGDALTDAVKQRFYLYLPVVEYAIILWSHVQIANKNFAGGEDVLHEQIGKAYNRCSDLLQSDLVKSHPAASEQQQDEPEKSESGCGCFAGLRLRRR